MSTPTLTLYYVCEGEVSIASDHQLDAADSTSSILVAATGWRAALLAAAAYDDGRIGIDNIAGPAVGFGSDVTIAAVHLRVDCAEVIVDGDHPDPNHITRYLACAGDGQHMRCHDTLTGAVLALAAADGYGAEFARDGDGAMRLYSSHEHIGNNPYCRVEADAFSASSGLIDDTAAQADVARQIHARGCYHSRWFDYSIEELTYRGQELTHINGRPLAALAEEQDCSIDAIRSAYPAA